MSEIQPRYVIDTCSLTALKRNYPQENFPSIWEKITELSANSIIISSEEVFEELKIVDDDLLKWAKGQRHMFVKHIEPIQDLVKKILKSHTKLFDVKRGKSGADPFIIALAIHYKCSVVTEEQPIPPKNTNNSHILKIPNVCEDYNIGCYKLVDLIQKENFKF